MAPARTTWLKGLQLAVAVGVLVLFWLIYPGTLFVLTSAIGICYVLAAVAASRDRRGGIWLALTFSVLAFAFSTWGVYRYLDNGFDYLSGNFGRRTSIYWPAYLFLLVMLGSLLVVVLHVLSWRWALRPRNRRGARAADRGENR